MDWCVLLSLVTCDKCTEIDNNHVFPILGCLYLQLSNGTRYESYDSLLNDVNNASVFRASRSNNFYLVLLMIMLFVAILPIFYVIFHMRPSNCGPFVGQEKFYSVISDFYYNDIPRK